MRWTVAQRATSKCRCGAGSKTNSVESFPVSTVAVDGEVSRGGRAGGARRSGGGRSGGGPRGASLWTLVPHRMSVVGGVHVAEDDAQQAIVAQHLQYRFLVMIS